MTSKNWNKQEQNDSKRKRKLYQTWLRRCEWLYETRRSSQSKKKKFLPAKMSF